MVTVLATLRHSKKWTALEIKNRKKQKKHKASKACRNGSWELFVFLPEPLEMFKPKMVLNNARQENLKTGDSSDRSEERFREKVEVEIQKAC